jgi:hypothetical protein
VYTVTSDASGAYAFTLPVAVGTNYTVHVDAAAAHRSGDTSPFDVILADIPAKNLALVKVWSLGGTVTDSSSSALAGATVTLTQNRAPAVRYTNTDSTGKYTFGDLEDGTVLGGVTVTVEGFPLPVPSTASLAMTGNETRDLELIKLGGRITNGAGSGISGLYVTMSQDRNPAVRTVQTNASGDYTFENLEKARRFRASRLRWGATP